jgi:hypothetical protein
MKKLLLLVMVIGAFPWLAAFDLETSVSLRPDLSCTAVVADRQDLEPVYQYFSGIAARLRTSKDALPANGHQGAVDMVAKLAAGDQEHQAAWRAKIGRSLPAGVTVTALKAGFHDTVISSRLELACDDARKLWRIVVPESDYNPFRPQAQPGPPAQPAPAPGGGLQSPPTTVTAVPGAEAALPALAGPAGQSEERDPRLEPYRVILDRPFYGLEVVDLGDTVQVALIFSNPVAFMRAQVGDLPSVLKVAEGVYASSRFIFQLDTPFEVLSTNATRREGRKLTWEIAAAAPGARLQEVLVARLKK